MTRGNGSTPVLEELHRAEELVDTIEVEQERLRDRARRAVGVTGNPDDVPPLRQVVTESGAGWYPVAALGLLVLAEQLQNWALTVLGPEISVTLGVSKGSLGFLVLLKAMAVMAASLPMAAFVQDKPRRAVLAKVTAFVWAGGTLLSGFVTGAGGLLLALVGNGAAAGSVEAVHRPLLVDSYPPEGRVRVLSAYRAAFAAGTVGAMLLIGLVTGVLGFTWRAVFVAMGVLCVGAALLSLRLRDPGFGRFDVERVRQVVRNGADAGTEREHPQLGFFEICRRLMLVPTIRRIMAAWAVLGMMVYPLYTFLFFFLDEEWDMGPGARSAFIAVVWAVAVPALAVFGRRGEAMFREDPARIIRAVGVGLMVFVGAIAVAAASPWFAPMLVGFAVVFAVAALLQPALNVVMLSIIPPQMRAHASALAGIFLAGVGGIGGVLLLNGIDRRFGIGGAIVSMAVPGLIAALLMRSAAKTVNDDLDRMIDEIVEREEIEIVRSRGEHLPMLSCRHVDFSYGQLQVLFDVNFTVDDGEMVALLGTNGAGKSTLLRVISGLGLPSKGSVHFRGADITYLDAERRLGLGITQIPGGKATFGPLTVIDNLRVYGHTLGRGSKALERGIDATFEAFPRLEERRNQLATTLSGGEQQMLALGKAFILQPRLLLIDELSLGLAPKIVGELLDMVRRINATGTAVVLVEQSVNIALSLVDHAYFMEKGEIRFDGEAADLLGRGDLLRSVFLEGATKGLQ